MIRPYHWPRPESWGGNKGIKMTESDLNLAMMNSARALVIRLGLQAVMQGKRLSRNLSPTRCLEAASRYTGRAYKRGAYAMAIADLDSYRDKLHRALSIPQ